MKKSKPGILATSNSGRPSLAPCSQILHGYRYVFTLIQNRERFSRVWRYFPLLQTKFDSTTNSPSLECFGIPTKLGPRRRLNDADRKSIRRLCFSRKCYSKNKLRCVKNTGHVHLRQHFRTTQIRYSSSTGVTARTFRRQKSP